MRIGGSNPTKNTYNILRHALSHDLALKLRYTDKSGKTALGGTRLAQAIRGKDNYLFSLYFRTEFLA